MTPDDTALGAVLLPLAGERLLLPSLAMADTVATAGLRPPAAGAPVWLAGWLDWQDLELPVLRLESLLGAAIVAERSAATGGDRRARIVVLQATDGGGVPRFGIVCDGHPQLLNVEAARLATLPLRPSDPSELVLARVGLDGRDALIPDLEALETRLAGQLDDAIEAAAGP